ncbi:CHAT domain-containing tetratricopeptide repeat protein [[Phormidium] sp. ETS-05]|uniref:CHAT domain-containing tetratricopeptide repeat protein n=1 Tax=[Phormidium] sp. ETS-05 TaxID=222819 RepID=UPI0018EF14DB|nr:CHAT domain-containing tetratricopeptide repeat protein [[Phormidium] sp. ETS-05]
MNLALLTLVLPLLNVGWLATPLLVSPTLAQVPPMTVGEVTATAAAAVARGRELWQQGTPEARQEAIAQFQTAIEIYRQLGNKSTQAATSIELAARHYFYGELEPALQYYQVALTLWQDLGKPDEIATTLEYIGDTYSASQKYDLALQSYQQSLQTWQQVGNMPQQARTLYVIGSFYHQQFQDSQKALDYYHQRLQLWQRLGNQAEIAASLKSIGDFYTKISDLPKALEYYNQQLQVWQQVGDLQQQAATHQFIADFYRQQMAAPNQALTSYQQALTLWRQVGDIKAQATNLNRIGDMYLKLNQGQQAISSYQTALSLWKRAGEPSQESVTIAKIGDAHYQMGETGIAASYYEQAFAVNSENTPTPQFSNTATSNEEYYSKSREFWEALGGGFGEAVTRMELAKIERGKGDLTGAIAQMESALEIVENLRTQIADPELRSFYFATVQQYYELYIDILMQLHQQNPTQGYQARALEASESARARSLLEILLEAGADIAASAPPQLVAQEKQIENQLNALAKKQVELATSESPEAAAALETEIKSLLNQLRQVQGQIRESSPHYAAITQAQPLTVKEIQQLLDEDTLLLEYYLGQERSYVWAVSATSINSYELPPRATIEAAAKNFRDAITAPALRMRPKKVAETAFNLTELILTPLAQELQGNQRLLIVSDGALQTIPFSALSVPSLATVSSNRFVSSEGKPSSFIPLMVEHEIVNLPSASTASILRQELRDRPTAPKTIAVFADPVFGGTDDDRLPSNIARNQNRPNTTPVPLQTAARNIGFDGPISRLPYTSNEASQIFRLVPENQRFGALGFAATREKATSPELAQYRIIHFATHGFLLDSNPELSGLVLSLVDAQGSPVDGFLRLPEIYNLKLAADLVVLSACQTGLGKEIEGEGLIGLTRGFMYAGVPQVGVSLWSVDDEATSILMSKFYEGMLEEGLSPPAALRAAQIAIWQQQQWQSPYFWASFLLQGEQLPGREFLPVKSVKHSNK